LVFRVVVKYEAVFDESSSSHSSFGLVMSGHVLSLRSLQALEQCFTFNEQVVDRQKALT